VRDLFNENYEIFLKEIKEGISGNTYPAQELKDLILLR
jgi:hypothetical protein